MQPSPDPWSGWRDQPSWSNSPLIPVEPGGAERVWKETEEQGQTGPADSEGDYPFTASQSRVQAPTEDGTIVPTIGFDDRLFKREQKF